MEENETKKPAVTGESIPFPDEEWFGMKELDKSLEVFSYEVGRERKQVAFWIESKNHNESKVILAEYQETDVLTGTTMTDNEAFNDRMIREVVSYGDPPQYLSQGEIDKMKESKKSGLYTELVFRVSSRSGIVKSPSIIQKEKK